MSEVLGVLSTKVTDKERDRIDEAATASGMNRSEFIRAILFQKIEDFEQFLKLPTAVIPDSENADDISKLITHLQRRYPEATESEIIKSTLRLAIHNEKLLVSQKLKKFF